jgi:hypothetical protein
MEAYQQRVVKEHDELNIKIVKLEAFMASEAFTELSHWESELLNQQYLYMGYYLGVLSQRISLFKESGE